MGKEDFAASFKENVEKQERWEKRRQTLRFEKKAFLALAPFMEVHPAEIKEIWDTNDKDPAEELRAEHVEFQHVFPYPVSVQIKTLLDSGFRKGRLCTFFVNKLKEMEEIIVPFLIGQTFWVLTNIQGKRRAVAQARILYPAAGTAPDVYAIPLKQYIEENKEIYL